MFTQFSPNMLKTYELCPRKFFYKFVKNVSMPIDDTKFELGKNIHALASYYLRGENIERMEKALSKRESETWNYLKSLKYLSYELLHTEYNLMIKIGKYFYGGRLDAIVKLGEDYYILDYKTGSIPKDPKYDFQTMIYILAAKEFLRTKNLSFVYLDLRNREEFIVPYSEKLELEYKEKLINTVKKIESSDFKKLKTDDCCEYSKICF